MTKAQVLTVENTLGMYDGCYAQQRDGRVVGPWMWDGSGQRIVGWWCGREHRHPDGRWAAAGVGGNADIIAVVPAPLPEPIERYFATKGGEPLVAVWEKVELDSLSKNDFYRDCKVYRVRVEFLEEVTL